jgi:outer membrane protein assembly factor BamB
MKKIYIGLMSCFLLVGCSDGTWWGSTKKIEVTGERLKVIQTSTDLKVDEALKSSSFKTPMPVKNTGWYKSSGITSSMVQNLDLTMPLVKENLFSISGGGDFLIGGTPIIAENKIFAIGSDGIVTAYDIQNKTTVWQNDFFPNATKKGFFTSFGSKFLSGGLSFSEGVIYATAGLAEILAIDAKDGTTLWTAKLSSPSRATPLKTDNNQLIVQTADNKTFALDAKTGNILWNHIGIGEEISSLRTSAPIANNNVVIVQYTSGELYALALTTGEELWTENLASPLDAIVTDSHLHTVITSPTLDGNNVMAYGHDGVMGIFDLKTGKPAWKKQLGIDKQFWVSGDLVYAVTIDFNLIAINKQDGRIKWVVDLSELETTEGRTDWTSPIVGGSKVIVLDSQGSMFFFDMNTGEKLDQIAIDKDIYLSPIIANGNLFTLANNGSISMY